MLICSQSIVKIRYASRETDDFDVILFEIYWCIYVPIIISL